MKRVIIIIAALLMCLTACSDKAEKGSGEPVIGDVGAMEAKVASFYSDSVEFVSMEDEYSDEVFMFRYWLEDEKFYSAAEDFVLSECEGMSAETFAAIKFKEGTDKALIDEAAELLETEYINSLKENFKVYSPEAYEDCDEYKLNVYSDGILLVICPDKAEDVLAALK